MGNKLSPAMQAGLDAVRLQDAYRNKRLQSIIDAGITTRTDGQAIQQAARDTVAGLVTDKEYE